MLFWVSIYNLAISCASFYSSYFFQNSSGFPEKKCIISVFNMFSYFGQNFTTGLNQVRGVFMASKVTPDR